MVQIDSEGKWRLGRARALFRIGVGIEVACAVLPDWENGPISPKQILRFLGLVMIVLGGVGTWINLPPTNEKRVR